MKVFILTGEPFPNGMAATNRIKCYARAIHDGGLDCEVIIYRRTEVYGKCANNNIAIGTYEGVSFRYIANTPLRGRNPVIRQLNDKIDFLRVERYLRKNLCKGDVLFLYMAQPLKLMLSLMQIAKSNGAYCVRDLCELPYGTGAETEQTIRLRKEIVDNQFSKLDGIISISDALMNLAKTYTKSSCKHIKVPIMVEFNHYCIKKKYEDDIIPYIFHAGTLHQQKDGILGMLEAFGLAKQKLSFPIRYVLTGSIEASPHAKEIRLLFEKYHLEGSVEFLGYINRDQVREYLRSASLVISNRPKSKQDFYGFSTKLGEYLASGTPLITTNWGEAASWLKDGETAYIIEPEDIEVLSDSITRVFLNPIEAKLIGEMGKKLCRNYFDYKVWTNPLVDYFQKLGE